MEGTIVREIHDGLQFLQQPVDEYAAQIQINEMHEDYRRMQIEDIEKAEIRKMDEFRRSFRDEVKELIPL